MRGCFSAPILRACHFEDLLKGVVSEKTLTTAVKFVGVLWSERTKENLVKTINPLGEVEVNFDSGHGKVATRYLQFDFHRVRVDGKITHVLVAVSDVSARVDLARELQSSQTQAQAQVDTLLGISARRSDAACLLLERLERGDENDQRRAARAGARGKRIPQETRYPVSASALGQGRSRGLGAVLH